MEYNYELQQMSHLGIFASRRLEDWESYWDSQEEGYPYGDRTSERFEDI